MLQGVKVNPRIKLKLARVEHNLTQAELAEKVGVTRQTIGLIENGRYNPTLHLCIAIAKALNKTLNDLFWKENENEGWTHSDNRQPFWKNRIYYLFRIDDNFD